MEYGVFSPLLLKIRENPPHDISEGRGIVASHHQFLSIREQGRHCQFILEIPWSVYQKERGSVGRGKRKGCLGQSCEIVTFGIHYSQKEKSLHWSKAWKREIWWVQSDQWVHRLLPPWWMKAVAEKSQGSFPALNSPVITFIHSVENSKYWEFLNNYWKTLRVTKYRKRLWRTWHFTQGPHGHHTYVVPPESTSPSCWSRDVAQAEFHRDVRVRGWSLGPARKMLTENSYRGALAEAWAILYKNSLQVFGWPRNCGL